MQQDTDLPIDINAINRQQTTNTQITTRFGEHLFTENSVRVNDALAAQIQRRQETGIYFGASSYLSCLRNMVSRKDGSEMQPDERKARLEALLMLTIVETETIDGNTIKTFYYPDGRRMER